MNAKASAAPSAISQSAADPLWARLAARYRVELILFVFSFCAYSLSSWGMFSHQSQAPHFVWQAEAFLHGQLALLGQPPNLNDWVFENGHWYVSFPPFPSVLMMPFVAIWGLQLNDTIFTIVFAALNVALIYRLLRLFAETGEEGADAKSEADHAWLAFLFGFGTLAWSCGIRGEVWFSAETIGVTLTLCYLLASVRARHPVAAGFFLGCATITRTPLAFSIVFFLLEAFLAPAPGAARSSGQAIPRATLAHLREALGDRAQRGLALRRLALFFAPLAAVGLPMAWMNYVRFGSPTEFGHSHLYNNRVNADVERYGLFNYVYLERNLTAAFTRLPKLETHPFRLGFDLHGMSLLVTTPLFLFLLWPLRTPRITRALWLTVAAIALPGFLYQNDGFAQFGFRFSLDYTPYLFALLSLGARPLNGLFWAVGFAGVVVNCWGAVAFNRSY
jgi:hypothetical protein